MEQSLVLLISFDGFRWDYLDRAHMAGKETPNFDFLINNGVQAKEVKNAFVTKTFPNHYTIVTGMYEENHGAVGNEMYDPVFDEIFVLSDPAQNHQSKWFNNGTENGGGEPIWITNQKASTRMLERRSGVVMWPGSLAMIHGQKAYHSVEYNVSVPLRDRIDMIVNWFATEKDPINLGLLYFNEPDHLGHRVGPLNNQISDMIVQLDGEVGYLIKKLQDVHLFDDINIIITSDHGMTDITNAVNLDLYVDPSLYDHFGGSPVHNIKPKAGQDEGELLNLFKQIPNVDVYRKEEIPADYHYRNNRRIMPIVVVAHPGYQLTHGSNETSQKGNHGYNNSLPDMHPIFIAHGPAFKSGYVTKGFNNVDIYPLLCHLLEIDPYPNDGNLHHTHSLLNDDGYLLITIVTSLSKEFPSGLSVVQVMVCVGFAATVAGIMCVAACRTHRYITRYRRTVPVKLNLNNFHDQDGKTHLLQESEEDEIP